MWPLRQDPDDFAEAMLAMDRAAAFIGEALIVGDGLVSRVGTFAVSMRDRLPRRRRPVTSGNARQT
jgi:hypothetical protein